MSAFLLNTFQSFGSGGGAAPTDPDFASVVLLLDNTKRTNAATDSNFASVVVLIDNTKE